MADQTRFKTRPAESGAESGNVIFFVLLAVALIGLVTAAIRSGGEGANIDRETTIIRVSEVRQYASELERGIAFIMREGHSESSIRFDHPLVTAGYGTDITLSSATQLFNEIGGGVTYRLPPGDISSAAQWEFYGHTHLPDVGTDAPELVAVLPDITSDDFCERVNDMNGLDLAAPGPPEDTTGECINAGAAFRFTSANQFTTGAGIDTVDEASFTVTPAMQGCVDCGGSLHFYHVLMAR